MGRVKLRSPVWFIVAFIALFFIVSPLLMPHSPILDLEGTECAATPVKQKPRQKSTVNPRAVFKDDSVTCPRATFPGETTNNGWPTFRQALERYSKFHKEKLKQLKESETPPEDVRTLTWACSQSLCSGLGDQLYRIQYFFLLAMMSDRIYSLFTGTRLWSAAPSIYCPMRLTGATLTRTRECARIVMECFPGATVSSPRSVETHSGDLDGQRVNLLVLATLYLVRSNTSQ